MEPYEPLEKLTIASPCRARWSEMPGDHKVRFCSLCGLNVYNLSALDRREAQALVREREGRLCVRFYRRADGSVLTADCPIGLRAARLRLARLAGVMATLLAAAGGGFWERALRGVFSRSAARNAPVQAGLGRVALGEAVMGAPVPFSPATPDRAQAPAPSL